MLKKKLIQLKNKIIQFLKKHKDEVIIFFVLFILVSIPFLNNFRLRFLEVSKKMKNDFQNWLDNNLAPKLNKKVFDNKKVDINGGGSW